MFKGKIKKEDEELDAKLDQLDRDSMKDNSELIVYYKIDLSKK